MFRKIMLLINFGIALAIPTLAGAGALGPTRYMQTGQIVLLIAVFFLFFANFAYIASTATANPGRLTRMVSLWLAAKEKELRTRAGE